jgi:hypothetical protein
MGVYHVGPDVLQDTGDTGEHSRVEAWPLAQVPNRDVVSGKDLLLVRPGRVEETDCASLELLAVQGSHQVNGHLLGPGRAEVGQNMQ